MPIALRTGFLALCLPALCPGWALAQVSGPQANDPATLQLIQTVVSHEEQSMQHRHRFLYLSVERSDRTGGHLWTEKVAETAKGRVRLLIAEDGQSLNPQRAAAERERLADIAKHPDAFERREQIRANDEQHAAQLMQLLPHAFFFHRSGSEGIYERIDFDPDPAFKPQSFEQRVLHSMTGSMLIEPTSQRLHEVSAHLPESVTFGFGLLATINAGSSFSTTRDRAAIDPVTGEEWKMTALQTNIDGKAILFKTINSHETATHSGFQRLRDDISVPDAVALLLK